LSAWVAYHFHHFVVRVVFVALFAFFVYLFLVCTQNLQEKDVHVPEISNASRKHTVRARFVALEAAESRSLNVFPILPEERRDLASRRACVKAPETTQIDRINVGNKFPGCVRSPHEAKGLLTRGNSAVYVKLWVFVITSQHPKCLVARAAEPMNARS
jgi:hypothetical protein